MSFSAIILVTVFKSMHAAQMAFPECRVKPQNQSYLRYTFKLYTPKTTWAYQFTYLFCLQLFPAANRQHFARQCTDPIPLKIY